MRGTLGFRPRLRDALRPARRCLAAAPLDAVPVDRMTACGRAADFRVSSSRVGEVSGLAGADVNLEAETPHVFLRMNEKWFY
jgi:hypothetical protein